MRLQNVYGEFNSRLLKDDRTEFMMKWLDCEPEEYLSIQSDTEVVECNKGVLDPSTTVL